MAGFIKKTIKMGAELPKVGREKKLFVTSIGTKKSEKAINYSTASTKNTPSVEYKLPFSSIGHCYDVLLSKGSLTVKWFEKNEKALYGESTVNFRAMGSLFVLNGIAVRKDKDTYRRVKLKTPEKNLFGI